MESLVEINPEENSDLQNKLAAGLYYLTEQDGIQGYSSLKNAPGLGYFDLYPTTGLSNTYLSLFKAIPINCFYYAFQSGNIEFPTYIKFTPHSAKSWRFDSESKVYIPQEKYLNTIYDTFYLIDGNIKDENALEIIKSLFIPITEEEFNQAIQTK